MIHIFETNMHGRRTMIAEAATLAEAKAMVEAMGVAFMEDDADFIDCADAYMADGRVLAIQPEGFSLKDESLWKRAQEVAKERRDALNAFDAEFGL